MIVSAQIPGGNNNVQRGSEAYKTFVKEMGYQQMVYSYFNQKVYIGKLKQVTQQVVVGIVYKGMYSAKICEKQYAEHRKCTSCKPGNACVKMFRSLQNKTDICWGICNGLQSFDCSF